MREKGTEHRRADQHENDCERHEWSLIECVREARFVAALDPGEDQHVQGNDSSGQPSEEPSQDEITSTMRVCSPFSAHGRDVSPIVAGSERLTSLPLPDDERPFRGPRAPRRMAA